MLSKILFSSFFLPAILLAYMCSAQNNAIVGKSADGKYSYVSYQNDPLKARIYTLSNGLKVYLSVNAAEPRLQTFIAVGSGSKQDPDDATGLAHYLEHMLFKGTDKYGTSDWAKEEKELTLIENLYEKYNKETDESKRKTIYKQIDSVSTVAAKYAIGNEYDNMLASIGAKGTNAFTSVEQTVYVNDIPSNQLETWLTIEGERFRKPIMRIFHTELEAVYEEKNISIDSDVDQVYETLYSELFKNHGYGTKTTIGTIEHLKNPSLKRIKEYLNTYYVPNNMAIILCGDLDPDKTVALVDKYFGGMVSKLVPEYNFKAEKPLSASVSKTILGPESESVTIGFRLGAGKDSLIDIYTLINGILSNGSAGLIDLDLVKQKKVQDASAYLDRMEDYTVHIFEGQPKENQTTEEVAQLIIKELEKIKNGEFDEKLISSVINNLKIQRLKSYERNSGRAYTLLNSFVTGMDWGIQVQYFDRLQRYTKQDIMKAALVYNNGYVVIHKKQGERIAQQKIQKPQITPLNLNQDKKSAFAEEIKNRKPEELKPVFIDYDKYMRFLQTKGAGTIAWLNNTENDLFTLTMVFHISTDKNPNWEAAIEYLKFCGNSKFSSEELSKQFYALGCTFSTNLIRNYLTITLSGLKEHFVEGFILMEDLLNNPQVDSVTFSKMQESLIKKKNEAKKDPAEVAKRLSAFAMYGILNPMNKALTPGDIKNLTPESTVKLLGELQKTLQRAYFYGNVDPGLLTTIYDRFHKFKPMEIEAIQAPLYRPINQSENKIFLANYDMVQAEISMIRNGMAFNQALVPEVKIFNEYFGGGMSSMVFQTIREAKALAYSTYSYFGYGPDRFDPFVFNFYIGTQADKLPEAISAMMEMVNTFPKNESNFEAAKLSIRRRIESERLMRNGLLMNYEGNFRLGILKDIRQDVYLSAESKSLINIEAFYKDFIQPKNFTMTVLADLKKVNKESLQKYGNVEEINLTTLFGY